MTVVEIDPGPAAVREAPRVRQAHRGWWWLVLTGGLLGITSTVWQTVERIAYAANSDAPSVCEISTVVSCSSVYSHWQSSALGIPNSLIALPVFALISSAAISGLLGSRLSPRFLVGLLGLSVFMTGFIVWYLEQTAFAIGALCLFCAACMVSILLTAMGLTRVVDSERALGEGPAGHRLHTFVDSWGDYAVWFAIVLGVVSMLFFGLFV